MTFQELHQSLTEYLGEKVKCGEVTERGLARRAGISQPHLHNVLKGKRLLSPQSADLILREMRISVADLIALRR